MNSDQINRILTQIDYCRYLQLDILIININFIS